MSTVDEMVHWWVVEMESKMVAAKVHLSVAMMAAWKVLTMAEVWVFVTEQRSVEMKVSSKEYYSGMHSVVHLVPPKDRR